MSIIYYVNRLEEISISTISTKESRKSESGQKDCGRQDMKKKLSTPKQE